MDLQRLTVGSMDNNAYLLTDAGEGLLIDAAADPLALLAWIGDQPIGHIVTTHRHHDHVGALAALAHHCGARLVAGEPDAEAIGAAAAVTIDDRVVDGDTVEFGDVRLQVIRITGHTPGSICLLYDDPDGTPHLWTGDSLFPGGVGNTFGDADAFASLINDVETKIFGTLPDETWFYPGHGNDSTLGEERPHLAEWRKRGW